MYQSRRNRSILKKSGSRRQSRQSVSFSLEDANETVYKNKGNKHKQDISARLDSDYDSETSIESCLSTESGFSAGSDSEYEDLFEQFLPDTKQVKISVNKEQYLNTNDDSNIFEIGVGHPQNGGSPIKDNIKLPPLVDEYTQTNVITSSGDKPQAQQRDMNYLKVNISIPRIIMQTWKNKDVPNHWKISPESVKTMMPDWQHILLTDDDNLQFVKDHFPDFLPYYKAFPYAIQRADAIRYMWLYKYGGIYMDLDFEVLKPLDHLFEKREILHPDDKYLYLVNSGNLKGWLTNSFMASEPEHPFWLEVIEEMKKNKPWWAIGKHMEVMNTTGPLMLNRVGKRSRHHYITIPGKYVMPCSVCDIACFAPDTYLKPLKGGSWIATDTKVYNFFLCNWKKILLFTVVAIIIIFVIYNLVKKEKHKNNIVRNIKRR